jgi:hypothetical protein
VKPHSKEVFIMHPSASPTRLLPQQTRLIHASEGVRLRVVSGRLWLTQPNVAQDLFLGPGDCVDLMQDWVVIGAEAGSRTDAPSASLYSAYALQPLVAPAPKKRGLGQAMLASALRWRARVAGVFKAAPSGAPAP